MFERILKNTGILLLVFILSLGIGGCSSLILQKLPTKWEIDASQSQSHEEKKVVDLQLLFAEVEYSSSRDSSDFGNSLIDRQQDFLNKIKNVANKEVNLKSPYVFNLVMNNSHKENAVLVSLIRYHEDFDLKKNDSQCAVSFDFKIINKNSLQGFEYQFKREVYINTGASEGYMQKFVLDAFANAIHRILRLPELTKIL